MRYPQIKFGSFTAASTPADVTVDLGFVPDYVLVRNPAGVAQYELFKSEGTGKGLKSHAASTYHNILASGGLELVDTETIQTTNPVKKTKVQGFKVVAALQTASNPCYWMAIRES